MRKLREVRVVYGLSEGRAVTSDTITIYKRRSNMTGMEILEETEKNVDMLFKGFRELPEIMESLELGSEPQS